MSLQFMELLIRKACCLDASLSLWLEAGPCNTLTVYSIVIELQIANGDVLLEQHIKKNPCYLKVLIHGLTENLHLACNQVPASLFSR